MAKRETPGAAMVQLRSGYFEERKGYAVWRTHGTDDWLLILTLGGRGRFGFVGGEVVAHPKDIVLIRPGTLHDYSVEWSLQRWDFLWTHFHPRTEWVDWLNWPEVAPGLMKMTLSDRALRSRITRRFRDVHEFNTGARRRRQQLAMNALEEILLWCDQINPSASRRLDERIAMVMEFACQNLHRALTLEELADVGGLSSSRLSHLFREQVGLTPIQFIETQRLDRGGELLGLTQLSVKEIARKVGFENPFYFTLRFKKRTGQSPRAYRNATKNT